MQSVSSNAVAEAISKIADYNIAETVVGTCGGKPRYRVIFDDTGVNIPSDQWIVYTYTFVSKNVEKVCKIEGTLKFSFGDTIDINSKYCAFYLNSRSELICYQNYTSSGNNANAYIVVEYTKTTD